MGFRRLRIGISFADMIYHTMFLIYLNYVVNTKLDHDNCKVPISIIVLFGVSNLFWIIHGSYTLCTPHPEDSKTQDEKDYRYKKDIIFQMFSYTFRFFVCIMCIVLLKKSKCFNPITIPMMIEVILYTYVVLCSICVIEPLFQGSICLRQFTKAEPKLSQSSNDERQYLFTNSVNTFDV